MSARKEKVSEFLKIFSGGGAAVERGLPSRVYACIRARGGAHSTTTPPFLFIYFLLFIFLFFTLLCVPNAEFIAINVQLWGIIVHLSGLMYSYRG